jgi:ABC-2 type transport system ATP-binding protein
LGPNGAGKTTALALLSTLLEPDSGTVRIAGLDASTHRSVARRNLGFVPQSIALYPTLTASQNLRLFLRIHGFDLQKASAACAEALDLVDLTDRANDRVATLSGGMQRRLNLACGISHRPETLLLDEPSVGVDPQSRSKILQTIRKLANDGGAVIYSTHYMEEVEWLCDRVIMIDRGKVVAAGSVADVIAMSGGYFRMEFFFVEDVPDGWYGDVKGVKVMSNALNGRVMLRLDTLEIVPELLRRARTGGGLREFRVHSPNLSDAFMMVTGHSLRDDPS